MSTIKVNNIVPPNAGEGVSIDGLQMPTAGALNNRNLIMNGAMVVSQKPTATGLTNGNSNTYIIDRFGFMESGSPSYQFTYSQDTDVPTGQGFANSLKWLCTTADTNPAGNERLRIRQGFEGQNLQCIKKGTANAETLTLSFWVKTNLSGDISVVLEDTDNSRIISKNATIASGEVNTWVYKTLVFPGDTTGALDNDNAKSMTLEWYVRTSTDYNSGTQATTWEADNTTNKSSNNNIDLGSAVNNYLNMTGVQLEVGSKATPFEHESYGQTLAKCQRYFEGVPAGSTFNQGDAVVWSGQTANNAAYYAVKAFTVEKRAIPTVVMTNSAVATGFNTATLAVDQAGTRGVRGSGTSNTNANGRYFFLQFTADAEL